jgi:hypothetical protein
MRATFEAIRHLLRWTAAAGGICGGLLFGGAAAAHSASVAYLLFDAPQAETVAFTWRIALRDLDALLDLDTDADGKLTWSEVEDRAGDINALAAGTLALRNADQVCTPHFEPLRLVRIDNTGFAQLNGTARCARAIGTLTVDYRLFAGVDPSHRVLITMAGSTQPLTLAPAASADLSFSADGEAHNFGALLADGVRHILGGFDHLLFLLALLLPAVLERRAGRWHARTDLRAALTQVVWIATAFTAAHSITLALASFGIVRVPARVIEPLIAVTVLAAALNNLRPVVTRRLASAAFAFGLIHGFGFAEVLAPLDLPAWDLAQALLAFNLGVEGGQLIAIGVAFALLAAVRRWNGYPRWVLGGGSAVLVLIACGWIVERVFDVAVFSG